MSKAPEIFYNWRRILEVITLEFSWHFAWSYKLIDQKISRKETATISEYETATVSEYMKLEISIKAKILVPFDYLVD